MKEALFDQYVKQIKSEQDIETFAQHLYEELYDEERLGLLDGDLSFTEFAKRVVVEGLSFRPCPSGRIDRIGLPGIKFSDGPRGCVLGHSTAFPVAMARAATFDLKLEEEVARAISSEIRAQDGNYVAAPCINLVRHPSWDVLKSHTEKIHIYWERWEQHSLAEHKRMSWYA
ncbi:hypothetical protein AKO1_007805 [Acrasis kona]|uniref:beta-glucosidase n=1 Tax=Acrasis kona TaxID=1008807 RepID=A0AAW2YLN3_9EUKA